MDLNLNALIGVTYLVPIAITLRRIYAPCFDLPEPISQAIARLDTQRRTPSHLASMVVQAQRAELRP